MRYVRLDQLADAGLSDGEMIDALASGLATLSLLLHRTRLGGRVPEGVEQRLDPDGMVLVPVDGATAIRCRYCGAEPGEWCRAWGSGEPRLTKRLHTVRLGEWRQVIQASVPKAGTAEEGDPDGR